MTTIDSLTQEYKDIAALLDQKRTELAAPLRSTLFERMQRVLIELPEIDRIEWNQYTPYFNDGEECTFSVHELLFPPADKSVDSELLGPNTYIDSEGWVSLRKGIETLNDRGRAVATLEKEFKSIESDILRFIFGDHVTVTVRRDSTDFEVDDCDHD